MKEYKPYCYLLGWSILNKWYYGSEFGFRTKIANPTNLWSTYFTSSKHVKEFVKIYGEPDIIQIRKIFTTDKETISWEYRVLRKLKVRNNNKWLNVNDGRAPVGVPWSQEQKEKHSLKVSGKNNPMYGRKHSEYSKSLISKKSGKAGKYNGMFGRNHKESSKTKMSDNRVRLTGELNPMYNKTHTDTSKEKMSKSHNPKIYSYNHPTHGRINATMRQMISLYPELKLSGLKGLSSNRLKTYKGWNLYINPTF